jgi:hypothetical protein
MRKPKRPIFKAVKAPRYPKKYSFMSGDPDTDFDAPIAMMQMARWLFRHKQITEGTNYLRDASNWLLDAVRIMPLLIEAKMEIEAKEIRKKALEAIKPKGVPL